MRLLLRSGLCGLIVSAATVAFAQEKPNDKTLGLKAPEGATVLFSADSLDHWVRGDGKSPAEWKIMGNVFEIAPGKGSIQTKEHFGDFQLHLEFSCPYMPNETGQGRGNSGVYLGGIYELQVLDSFGLVPQKNDCGAIYNQIAPRVNACKPPLQWQTYDVTFHKAVAENGKVTKKARVTVIHNGINTIDNAEISPCPAGADNQEGEKGPILLQDHGNKVQYRNIWIKPLTP